MILYSISSVTNKQTNKPPQKLQNLYYQTFQHQKSMNLSDFFSVKNIRLGDQFLQILIFKVLCFLKKGPIFVGSVHNFGRSEDDML